MNSSTLTNDEAILITGTIESTGITKTQSVSQNTPFTTSYMMGLTRILYIPLGIVYIIL